MRLAAEAAVGTTKYAIVEQWLRSEYEKLKASPEYKVGPIGLVVRLVPWMGRLHPEDPTTGLLWALVPAFEVGTTAEVAVAVGEEEDE